ncbi:MAG: hypothetical protein U0Q11_18870 [Vicinamibacterales bacterium]
MSGKVLLGSLVLVSALSAACGSGTSPVAPSLSASVNGAQAQGGGGGGGTCTLFNDFKASAGYAPSTNSSVGAIWVQWKLNSCASPSGLGIQILVTVTDVVAGTSISVPGMLAQQTIDFDAMKLGTQYHVDWTVSDNGTGAVLINRTADLTTPSHNNRVGL